MSLAQDILRANRSFYQNYHEATVVKNGQRVMMEGIVIDNEWYIFKVGCFLISRLKARKKRGGENEW